MKYEERYSNDHHGQTEPIPNINLVVNIQKPVEKRKSIVAPLATANRDRRSANPSLSKPPLLKKLMAERDCDQIRSRPDRNSSQEKIDRIRTDILGKTTANGAKEQTDKDDAPKKRPVRKPSHKASCDQLVRNTPTELFQMYQESWNKYKKLMPGENSREDVRAVVRKKLQVKPEEKSKVNILLITILS